MPALARKRTRFNPPPPPSDEVNRPYPRVHRVLGWVRDVVMPPSMPISDDDLAEETGTTGSSSAADWKVVTADEGKDDTAVSHIVVENDMGMWTPPSSSDEGSGLDRGKVPKEVGEEGGVEHGEREAGDLEKGRRSSITSEPWIGSKEGSSSSPSPWKPETRLHHILVTNIYGGIIQFFNPKFPEPATEAKYRQEAWYGFRQGAVPFSSFFTIAWILTASLQPTPMARYNKIAFVIVNGILSGPLPFLVAFDLPRRCPWLYKLWLLGASFEFACSVVINMNVCGFYGSHPNCPNAPSYIALFYWAIGLPVIAILGLGQSRLLHLCGVLFFDLLTIGMVLIEPGAPVLMIRNLVNYSLFNVFLLMASYLREQRDRKLFSLRLQLKSQFRATQSAQVAERRATVAHKRFAAYIYHEVRVPLNTATLAVQNLEGESAFSSLDGEQRDMIDGLRVSLDLMAKVLSDSLSFERMESGKLLLARNTFELSKAIDLVVLSHRAQAESTGLDLRADMDPEIERTASRGVFVGDPLRLTQVIGNLVSNACKFTPAGSVRIATKLLYPRPPETTITPEHTPLKFSMDSVELFQLETLPARSTPPAHQTSYPQYQPAHASEPAKAIIRFEVHDTGVGLRPADVAGNSLFSPYKQTEIGRRQGNKGSGLGLALCMQIVSLMQGRMGVESRLGRGSCFWFEVPLTIPEPGRSPDLPLARDFALRVTGTPVQGDGTPRFAPPHSPMQSDRGSVVGSPALCLKTSRSSNSLDSSAREMRRRQLAAPAATPPPLWPPVDIPAQPLTPVVQAPGLEAVSGKLASPVHIENEPQDPPLQALVVDDDRLTRMLMTRMVKRLGHVVTTAENGALATDLIRARNCGLGTLPPFDVMFLDNHMPVMTGVDATRAIRSMGCEIFIVGCTGNALREDQEEYLEAGADQVLTKPVREGDVREMLNEARDRRDGV